MKPPRLGGECPSCHQIGMLVRRGDQDVCQYCGTPGPPPDHRYYLINLRFMWTTPLPLEEVERRVQEELGVLYATLERMDSGNSLFQSSLKVHPL